ncbi:MAG: phosphotransferase [Deltaproteobacteria bacterium]|nr:phosphotransferase [Deltaproteobacteria bacterium]
MSEENSISTRIEKVASNIGIVENSNKLVGDASTRTYFRISFRDRETAIAMVAPKPGSNEETPFIEVQKYLENLGLPVPKIYFHDPEAGIVVLEDLGDDLLENVVSSMSVEEMRSIYTLALDTLLDLQRTTSLSQSRCLSFDLAFDEAKLIQEMDFFMTHFVKGWARKNPEASAIAEMARFFKKICSKLASEPRVFAHRDYHSRNLILKNNRLYMIDFQDARMGPVQYDPASLLRDSYVSLPEDLVENLLYMYFEKADFLVERDFDYFRRIFDLMSLQRNIKALGTFGYQIAAKGSTRYISSISRTAANVLINLRKYPEFSPHYPALEEYILAPALSA